MSARKRALLRRIRLVVLDVDGVLTDGRMVYGSDGTQYKFFDVYDGYGITHAIAQGLKIVVLSRGNSEATTIRAQRLGMNGIYQNVRDKLLAFNDIEKELGIGLDETCFMGDDVYDLGLLQAVAFSAAPATAYPPVRDAVDYVTTNAGGRGAVREVLDMILEAKGLL